MWAIIKKAINSTLGTNKFKPLNELFQNYFNSSYGTNDFKSIDRLIINNLPTIKPNTSYVSNQSYNFDNYQIPKYTGVTLPVDIVFIQKGSIYLNVPVIITNNNNTALNGSISIDAKFYHKNSNESYETISDYYGVSNLTGSVTRNFTLLSSTNTFTFESGDYIQIYIYNGFETTIKCRQLQIGYK